MFCDVARDLALFIRIAAMPGGTRRHPSPRAFETVRLSIKRTAEGERWQLYVRSVRNYAGDVLFHEPSFALVDAMIAMVLGWPHRVLLGMH